MPLIYEREIIETEELDFFEELRAKKPEDFLAPWDERLPDLIELKADLAALDDDFARLCDLLPQHTLSYRRQRKEAEHELAIRAKEILPYLKDKP